MTYPDHAIAIIGMSLRFPGASTPELFWKNTLSRESQIRSFSRQQMIDFGVDPDVINRSDFVPAMASIDGMGQFDHHFFNMSPREAEITDPQHRLFLECGYEALEQSGYAHTDHSLRIGVFGGTASSSYFNDHLINKTELRQSVGDYQLNLANGHDFITTRLSYKLNLRGPSINIQTACSTGLSATHTACEHLLLGDCDIALAGASSLIMPHQYGYIYREGGIGAKDGCCRPFDESATGTVRGNGAGFVVLKRLQDAIDDGDIIDAVIRGSGINNDGADKVGFTAPSVNGQASAIREALYLANVEPDSVGYIETHGTGTPMGDPIEIMALHNGYGSDKSSPCAISSVKSQIGHLDVAAGIAGLIRAALALKNRTIPPTLNFETPNKNIPFDDLPFYVAKEPQLWSPDESDTPFRAGVSSFGIGGTNVHMILEEFVDTTKQVQKAPDCSPSLLLFSGKTSWSAQKMSEEVLQYSQDHTSHLDDIAHTLAHRRPNKPFRTYRIFNGEGEAVADRGFSSEPIFTEHPRKTALLFSGQGDALKGYCQSLYEESSWFRDQTDQLFSLFEEHMELNLKELFRGGLEPGETLIDQPYLFTVQYVMGRWLLDQGLQPDYLMGHSIGELAAACLADVFSIQDAVKMVAARAQIMQESPEGAMMAVGLSQNMAESFIKKYSLKVEIASVNAPGLTVLGGAVDAIQEALECCRYDNIFCRKLHTRKGFHTSLFNKSAERFEAALEDIAFKAPCFTMYSNVRGGEARPEEGDLVTPEYWAKQMRHAVLLADMFAGLPEEDICFIEFGPGQTLLKLVKKSRPPVVNDTYVATYTSNASAAEAHFTTILGRLWASGVEQPARQSISQHQSLIRIPTYPFDRSRFWIPKSNQLAGEQLAGIKSRNDQVLYTRQWKRMPALERVDREQCLLILSDSRDTLQLFNKKYAGSVELLYLRDETNFKVAIERKIKSIDQEIVHLVYAVPPDSSGVSALHTDLDYRPGRILSELVNLVEAHRKSRTLYCSLITTNAYEVVGSESIDLDQRWLDGLATGVEWDTGQDSFKRIDIDSYTPGNISLLFDVLCHTSEKSDKYSSHLAIRNGSLWKETFMGEPLTDQSYSFNKDDVWVLFGGNGGIGTKVVERLREAGLRCAVVGRSVSNRIDDTFIQISADITRPEEVQLAIEKIRGEWGKINYIIHLAAQVKPTRITEFDREDWDQISAPKIKGLQNILAADLHRDVHIILFSSLSSVLGGMDHTAYSAANAWLDGAASLLSGSDHYKISSISWDTWKTSEHEKIKAPAITAEYGLKLLFQLIASPHCPHWIISSVPMMERQDKSVPEFNFVDSLNKEESRSPNAHPRPSLPVEFIAPFDDLSQQIAQIWSQHLAIDPIGIDDNFFDLGGDSLLLVHLHSQLDALSDIALSKTDLFEYSTIRTLSAFMRGEKSVPRREKDQDRTKKMKQQLFNKKNGQKSSR